MIFFINNRVGSNPCIERLAPVLVYREPEVQMGLHYSERLEPLWQLMTKKFQSRKAVSLYTQRNFSGVLLNQPEIMLYLPFSDWFGSKRTSVWIQINRKMVNTIWFQVDLIRFRKLFSVCNELLIWWPDASAQIRRTFFPVAFDVLRVRVRRCRTAAWYTP